MKRIIRKYNIHIQKIAKAFFNANVNIDDHEEIYDELPKDTYYGIKVQITGRSHQGQLILGFPKESAIKLTESVIASLAPDELMRDELLESTLEEFLNTVTGQFLQEELLSSEYGRFVFSPPFLWTVQENQFIGVPKAQNGVSVLSVNDNHFYSMISIRKVEQNQLQAELFLQEKLTAVGELAAGIAHEINNPLSAIITYSNLIKKFIAGHEDEVSKIFPKLPDYMKNISLGAERCQSIAKNMLDFSHQKDAPFSKFELANVLEKTKELVIAHVTKKSINLIVDIPSDLSSINGDPIRLQQVFTNLLMNAVYAVPKGGEIKIKVSEIENNIHIDVIDNGAGIPDHLQNKIFNPFFTTKPVGIGTGLGLPIVFNIIKEHKGSITLKSKKNKGTTFHIELPIYK